MDSFDLFRTRRHTAILALVAIGVSVGILTWSIITIAGLNSSKGPRAYASGGPTGLALASAPQQSNRTAKADFKDADTKLLMAEAFAKRLAATVTPGQADPQLAGWENDLDWLRAQSLQAVKPIDNAPGWQTAGLSVSPAPAAKAASGSVPVSAPSSADPTALAAPPAPAPAAAIAPADADPQPVTTAPLRATAHAVREPVGPDGRSQSARAAAKPHRIASRGTYTEKTVEQGDSGEVSFRYRRRACTPGNMVDVCYMPAADRQRIVIERY